MDWNCNLVALTIVANTLPVFQVLTGLEVLDLSTHPDEYKHSKDPMLTDSIMPTIAGLRRLQHLNLSGLYITDAAMPNVALLTNLRELVLENMARVGESGLQQLKGLTQLSISYSKLIERGF